MHFHCISDVVEYGAEKDGRNSVVTIFEKENGE